MAYKWKPSVSQRRAFAERMKDPTEQQAYNDRKLVKADKRRAGSQFDYHSAGGNYIPTQNQYEICWKILGYTDSGRWANGARANCVYMALYEVHLGKQYCINSSDSSLCASKLQKLGNYDSTWGQKGPNLRRHEYITYKSSQSTIKYLVKFQD